MQPPIATYRLQLHADFDFGAAAALADYLEQLGISHVYLSPCLQAAAGSVHGYDVVDPTQVNIELGGESEFDRMTQVFHSHGLRCMLDVVPNHMAISSNNRWWNDVLEDGPASRYANYFAVDWDSPEAKLRNMVLVPILADHYGRILEAGELRVEFDRGASPLVAKEGGRGRFVLRYHEHRLPLAPRSLDTLLGAAAIECGSDALAALADAFGNLPPATATDFESVARRHRDKAWLREQLTRLCEEEASVVGAIEAVVAKLNNDVEALHALLERQNYRLAYWRTGERELGYRRFFDINSLVGLRVEDEQVFAETHQLVLRWLNEGKIDALRIDHPDGMRDPADYFERLRAAGAASTWIVAEKILAPHEILRPTWPIDGTTGYEFIFRSGGLFIDPRAEATFTDFYHGFTEQSGDYAGLVRQCKHLAMHGTLAADVNRLTAMLVDICERHRRHRDFTRHQLHEALREVMANFDVYRSYVRAGLGRVDAADRAAVTRAVEQASQGRPDLDPELFAFLCDLLLLRVPGDLEAELAMRFQQVTAPVMAKGVEDTAFYRFNRLVALNEVGSDPSRFSVSVEEFHQFNLANQAQRPHTLLATSTHDTKRSEDVRARLALLSEIPQLWESAVRRWSEIAAPYCGAPLPDRNLEYLYYQTLVGAWPIGVERAVAYMEKAMREAKVHTSWTVQDAAYEEAVRIFVSGTLGDPEFCKDLGAFVAPLVQPGRLNSLAQNLLKLTAPGVPDIYQGNELWDLSLVDPDNRRPVDFRSRTALLIGMHGLRVEEVWDSIDEGLPKLWLIRRALTLRRRHPEWFGAAAGYQPLPAEGARAAHVIGFTRGDCVVSIAPRLVIGLNNDWRDTAVKLGDGSWYNWLTDESVAGGKVALGELLRGFPCALLARDRP